MICVAGLWELAWNTPIKEIELWEYPLRDFEVDQLYMTPVTGIVGPVIERGSMEEILQEHRDAGRRIVFVDEAGSIALTKFQHPTDVLYVFGRASLSPWRAYGKPADLSVRIETPQNRGMLWPHQAASILLYDRMLKRK